MESAIKMKERMRLPLLVAPMFLISNPEMVIQACKSGIIGSFPALNARTGEVLNEWMTIIKDELMRFESDKPNKKAAPWAVNFITHRSNKRYREDLKLIEMHKPPIVITSLGDPSPIVEIVHQYGGLVFTDVISVSFAKKAIAKGSDGLILVSAGAGGHGGTYSPFAFIHEVRSFFQGPIILAGGMSKGEDILAAEILGADFAYFGTRFIPATESMASDDYKQMIIDSGIEDILYTDVFSGIHANYLIPSITKAGLDPENLPGKTEMDFAKREQNDAKAWKNIWGAGQGTGSIHSQQSIASITEELFSQYTEAKRRLMATAR